MIDKVGDFFLEMDRICDNIPVVSTVSNLVDIFQKVIVNFVELIKRGCGRSSSYEKGYYASLKNKSYLRCTTLLIPAFGNLSVILFDQMQKLRKINIEPTFQSPVEIQEDCHEADSNEPDITPVIYLDEDDDEMPDKASALSAVAQDGYLLEGLDEKFKDDEDIVLAAVKNWGGALQFASERLKKNKKVVLAAMENIFSAYICADSNLYSDKEFVLALIELYQPTEARTLWAIFTRFSDTLKQDRDVMLAAVKKEGWILVNACDELKKDAEIRKAAIEQNPDVEVFV